MSSTLFVGNIALATTDHDLRELFSLAGPVASCRVIRDRETGASKGFAFVEMISAESAGAARSQFNGHELHGKLLKVNEARPKGVAKGI